MTIQNTYTDTTANAAGIPTATASQDNKDMFIGDNTDIEKGGAASHFVQPQDAPVRTLPLLLVRDSHSKIRLRGVVAI